MRSYNTTTGAGDSWGNTMTGTTASWGDTVIWYEPVYAESVYTEVVHLDHSFNKFWEEWKKAKREKAARHAEAQRAGWPNPFLDSCRPLTRITTAPARTGRRSRESKDLREVRQLPLQWAA